MHSKPVKIIVVGECGVGKSCLARRFVDNEFTENYTTTIGVDYYKKDIIVDDVDYHLQICDTGGAEQFRSLAPSYYRRAAGALVVYDVTNRESFERLSSWLLEVQVHGGSHVSVMIVGNKSDCPRVVSRVEGFEFALNHGTTFMETSAQSNENVEEVYKEMVQKIKYDNNLPEENIGIEKITRVTNKHLKSIGTSSQRSSSCC